MELSERMEEEEVTLAVPRETSPVPYPFWKGWGPLVGPPEAPVLGKFPLTVPVPYLGLLFLWLDMS